MVYPEDIDSGHSNFQLGTSSDRRHYHLAHLQIYLLNEPKPANPDSNTGSHCDACRHTALIDVSVYSDDAGVPSFKRPVVCAKCGGRGNKIDVRPNWKEQPVQPTKLRYD